MLSSAANTRRAAPPAAEPPVPEQRRGLGVIPAHTTRGAGTGLKSLGDHENPFKTGTALPSNENRKGFKISTRMGATETILSKTQPVVNAQIRKAKNRTVLISAQKYRGKIYLCRGRRKSYKFLFERFL